MLYGDVFMEVIDLRAEINDPVDDLILRLFYNNILLIDKDDLGFRDDLNGLYLVYIDDHRLVIQLSKFYHWRLTSLYFPPAGTSTSSGRGWLVPLILRAIS